MMPEVAKVTKELIYELLKREDYQLGELCQDISEVKSELGSIRSHLIATEGDVKNIYGVLARQDDRLSHIERSLDGV